MQSRFLWTGMLTGAMLCGGVDLAGAQQSNEEELEALAKELEAAEAEEATDAETRTEAADGAMNSMASRARRQAMEVKERLTEDPQWRPTHKQVDRIELTAPLNNMCLDSQGRILACCGDKKLRVLSPDGELLETRSLTFVPEAISVRASDGAIFVGGQGQLARFSAAGELEQKTAFPPPPSEEEQEKMIEALVEQLVSQMKQTQLMLKGLKTELAKVQEQIKEAPLDEAEKRKIAKMSQEDVFGTVESLTMNNDETCVTFKEGTSLGIQARMLEDYLEMLGGVDFEQQQEKMVEQARQQAKQSVVSSFTGLAAADDDLFVVCSGAGYSYNAWRMNQDFEESKMIVSAMSGCCRQLDCQTHDGNLWLAMNTQHKVLCYDRDGKLLSSFGKNDAQAADGFGGCCEPKNLRFSPDGKYVYCAQSGPPVCVKRFTLEGEFQDVVCFPIYETGCVRVSVDTADGVFYMMSPSESTIYVFKADES